MYEIIVLVLEVIILIITMKISPEEATWATVGKYGVEFSKIWRAVPKMWK
ncbi:hypothetical protein KTC96_06465 [Clostridium estertheticum]|nr:hypothetical protein [Clostridium estertheticum]MBX4262348.1 hypothetical protein [Clostridium estertheticum]WLC71641.1 hypothetical protein KTC96_06465 [Clostridium estertheticum]